ncbi:MAG: YggS family pyridoxal phosphate-dependent enzyme [Propionibacteriales bacterium]|nr:YggS family pyridoxal phosphate-dependent enzyme [Propionibacteriales bacterium]
MDERRDELAANLAAVRERIRAACAAAGRGPDDVGLVVVTKFFPESDVRLLADLGVDAVGENRHQEAAAKAAACADLGLSWHFIGSIQSNKAAAVAAYSDVVESVDRVKLVAPLDRGAQERGRDVDCLVQVSLDPAGAQGRGGASPEEVRRVADAVAAAPGLRLRGVMAVAPLGEPALPAFERLAVVAAELRRDHAEATVVSAGMSGDLEEAIRCGATHVRVGSAVLGQRPPIK